MINVLLVDDHELVRAGIRRILEDIKGIKVVGEACCGEDAVKWCRTNAVDVVLMDMNMPGIGGLEATRKIARSTADIKVIMLTRPYGEPVARQSDAGWRSWLSQQRRCASGGGERYSFGCIRTTYIASDIAQQNGAQSDRACKKRKRRSPVCLNASCRLC
ncbi:invasion response-regulator [Salmonella enterica subsp. enterica]|uniref:Invasion response-regulator n=1 Tax=Salmonella enterica I TaxID=59201 RepID=A0A379WRM0_SALET|nr:invasion response-regulator [Salmonella enterica subsp. enterica]